LALRFGPDMPDLPGAAVLLHRRHDPARRTLDPPGAHRCSRDWVGVQRGVDHGLHRLEAAENIARLRQPDLPLFGKAAGFVLGVAGLQGGPLGQL
jgi:hypothetical protein